MNVLDTAKEHFKEQLANGLQELEVPEWKCTVYYKPQANFHQQHKVIKLHTEGKLAEALIETLIIRACDKDGKPMFKSADRDILMRQVDPDVIVRVVTAINNKQQEAETNLGN
jgi:hypothetical protein